MSKKKKKDKKLRAQKRFYDVSTQNDQYWKPVGSGNVTADASIQRAGMQLRAIARSLDENLDLATGLLDTLTKKIVGTELKLIPSVRSSTGKPLKRINQQIESLWLNFCQKPETTRELSMAEAQRLVCRSWLRDGECLIHHVRGINRISPATKVSYAMELLEADYLPFTTLTDTKGDKNITAGVEKNQWGAPVAYNIYRNHPGSTNAYAMPEANETKRVLARDMVHFKLVKRLRQTRGVLILAPVLRRFEDLKDLEESERIKAKIQSSFSAAITKSTEFNKISTDEAGNRSLEMQSGMIFDDLLPGESIEPIGTTSPNPEITNWRSGQMRAIASGTMTAYSAISQDYEGSYSAMRQELQDAKINYEVLRCQFINDFLNPIYQQFIAMAQTQGLLQIPVSADMNTVEMPQWSIPATPWIDPKKEVESQILLIDNEIVSKSHVQRQAGIDPKAMQLEIDAEPKVEKKMEQEPAEAKPDQDEEEAA